MQLNLHYLMHYIVQYLMQYNNHLLCIGHNEHKMYTDGIKDGIKDGIRAGIRAGIRDAMVQKI